MKLNQDQEFTSLLVKVANILGVGTVAVVLLLALVLLLLLAPQDFILPKLTKTTPSETAAPTPVPPAPAAEAMWRGPDEAAIPAGQEGEQIRYGRELVAHTARYLGPQGSVLHISNGMNCQNCHLDAGTKPYGNNYALVASTYPKFRARSGTVEDQVKRVNDCFERSLNGKALSKDSKEMQAMVAYINWVGKDVPKGEKVKGSGFKDIQLLDRAASPQLGKAVYVQKCQVCHGANGEGMKAEGSAEYQFPPLWGKNSYNNGAGLYRISNFAKFVKSNMPLGVSHENPQLTDEEAWDVAAYVNSMPRPKKDISKDWPDISKKPFDHPFGPFSDKFSEKQHKYGPYKPIIAASDKAQ